MLLTPKIMYKCPHVKYKNHLTIYNGGNDLKSIIEKGDII